MTAADPIRLPNTEVLYHGVEVGSCVGGGCGGLVGTGDVGKVVGPGWVGGSRAIVGLAVVTNSGVAVGLGEGTCDVFCENVGINVFSGKGLADGNGANLWMLGGVVGINVFSGKGLDVGLGVKRLTAVGAVMGLAVGRSSVIVGSAVGVIVGSAVGWGVGAGCGLLVGSEVGVSPAAMQ